MHVVTGVWVFWLSHVCECTYWMAELGTLCWLAGLSACAECHARVHVPTGRCGRRHWIHIFTVFEFEAGPVVRNQSILIRTCLFYQKFSIIVYQIWLVCSKGPWTGFMKKTLGTHIYISGWLFSCSSPVRDLYFSPVCSAQCNDSLDVLQAQPLIAVPWHPSLWKNTEHKD